MDEIEKLCQSLSLTKAESVVCNLAAETKKMGKEIVAKCLVGKVLSSKRVNREAFKGVMENLWSCYGRVEVELIKENVFVFHFDRLEDRDRVIAREPWHFDKNLIILEKADGIGDVAKMNLKWVNMWVQIHNLPLMCMNRQAAKQIAEHVGTVVEIPPETKDCWGSFLRVKVRVDTTQPLKRGMNLNLDDTGNLKKILFRYEKLPDFCFVCGKVGHTFNECPEEDEKREFLNGNNPKYGSWLRAAPPDRLKFRSPKSSPDRNSHKRTEPHKPSQSLNNESLLSKVLRIEEKGDDVSGEENLLTDKETSIAVEKSQTRKMGSDKEKERQNDEDQPEDNYGNEVEVGKGPVIAREGKGKEVIIAEGSREIDNKAHVARNNNGNQMQASPIKSGIRYWKRAARGTNNQNSLKNIPSPLRRMIKGLQAVRKSQKKQSPHTKSIPKSKSQSNSPDIPNYNSIDMDVDQTRTTEKGVKRKKQLFPDEDIPIKKQKESDTPTHTIGSAEPAMQARREI